VAVPMGF